MKTLKQILLVWVLFGSLWFPLEGLGAPYGEDGLGTNFKQPDGSVIELRVFGDEFYAVTETVDGYTVVFDSAAKAYFYAVLSSGGEQFLSSGTMVTNGKPPKALGLRKHLRVSRESSSKIARENFNAYDKVVGQTAAWEKKKAETRAHREAKKAAESAEGKVAFSAESLPEFAPPQTTGGKVGVTILVDFPDETGTIPAVEVDNYFNQPGYSGSGNKGSVFDYFYRQSARKLRYNNVVTYYVRMQHPKSYYDNTSIGAGTCGRLLLTDALNILTAEGFDFSACTSDGSGNIDACNVLFAGGNSGAWGYGLWPHRWSLLSPYAVGGGKNVFDYQITNLGSSLKIGTVCHENGHMLCKYPDFYDYDTGVDDSAGCGKYTLMASGNHFYQTSPISVGAYLRYHSGWVDLVQLTSGMNERCSVRVDEGRIYMYDNPSALWPGEYFLIENRAKIGWEATSGLPDEGLLIMHCDENGDRDSQEMTEALHYECSIEQADNDFDLENDVNGGDAYDLFHSGGTGPNTSFSDSTSPNAHWWNNATTSTTSGDPSGLNINTISASGETMTFVIGSSAPTGTREIGVDQSAIYMETDFGQPAPATSFAVWNKKGGTLSYSITDNASWMSVSPSSGTATTESDVIGINFNTNGLSAGTYNGTITVSDSGAANSPQTIAVQLVVFAQPAIGTSVASVSSAAYAGNMGDRKILRISNTGGGALDYSLSWESDWLSLNSTNGMVLQEEDLILLDFDASGLGAGTYHDTLTISSTSAVSSPRSIGITLVVTLAPEVDVSFTSLHLHAPVGGSDSLAMLISNEGASDLDFNITDNIPAGVYTWSDSDDAEGPVYSWIDISSLGSMVSLGDDGESAMLNIGFDFPFFDGTHSQFQIGANGCISFSSGDVAFGNTALPSISAPSKCLMPFWDDLDPSAGGTVRYHSTAERLVVSWLGVPRWNTTNYETFQAVLYPDGRIVYQYKTLSGLLSSCTVGLQDSNTAGPYLQIVYNGSFLKNAFAVEILPPSESWLNYTASSSGTVVPGNYTIVSFNGSAAELAEGTYNATAVFECNDPDFPQINIPVTFEVGNFDVDGDGIPNWWEAQYYSVNTGADETAICANGVNTMLEAYLAGLDPTDPSALFHFTSFDADVPGTGHRAMEWTTVGNRLYDVYWTPYLGLIDFTVIASNFMDGVYTDTVHNADVKGFYKIEAKMEP